MNLKTLIQSINPLNVLGNDNVIVDSLTFDSREAGEGQVFFALKGEITDGHKYITDVADKKATAVVCEVLPVEINSNVCYVQVANSHEAMGFMASAFYGNPSTKLKLVGVTGTNGKTTTVTLLYHMFKQLGYKAGLLSTVTNYVHDTEVVAIHTTPDALQLNKLLAQMVDAGCEYCFMEVSSHAVVQKRIAGLHFIGAAFSNITHEHLDYHKTFEEYIRAKKGFFDSLSSNAFALINVDDKNGRVMVQNTTATIKTCAVRSMADFKCRIIEHSLDGMLLNMDGTEVWVRFIGDFNAYNLLTVYGIAILLGQQKSEILTVLSDLRPVSGRFEIVTALGKPTVIVDYAHTPDALINVIETINDIRKNTEIKLITVVGCGGNRDTSKRPVMAKIAAELSNKAILTSDNPRFEEPEAILADMSAGLTTELKAKTLVITDRREAIKTALFLASPTDVILIAGKGHEDYQEIKGVKHHFDDKEEVRKLIE